MSEKMFTMDDIESCWPYALENFENALRHLQCVLFRDGVGERLSDYLCELDDEIMRFKKQNDNGDSEPKQPKEIDR